MLVSVTACAWVMLIVAAAPEVVADKSANVCAQRDAGGCGGEERRRDDARPAGCEPVGDLPAQSMQRDHAPVEDDAAGVMKNRSCSRGMVTLHALGGQISDGSAASRSASSRPTLLATATTASPGHRRCRLISNDFWRRGDD